jgi:hypothetical protein
VRDSIFDKLIEISHEPNSNLERNKLRSIHGEIFSPSVHLNHVDFRYNICTDKLVTGSNLKLEEIWMYLCGDCGKCDNSATSLNSQIAKLEADLSTCKMEEKDLRETIKTKDKILEQVLLKL